MQRIIHPRLRNKIDLNDPQQARAWSRRLRIAPDLLKDVIAKVGNAVAVVTKEIELRRLNDQPGPARPIPGGLPQGPVEGEAQTPA